MIYYKITSGYMINKLNDNFGRFDYKTTRTFYYKNKIIGFADYFIIDKDLFLKNLRVVECRKKYGTLIIHYLFDNLHIASLTGYSINQDTKAFWEALGANFKGLTPNGFIIAKNNLICTKDI